MSLGPTTYALVVWLLVIVACNSVGGLTPSKNEPEAVQDSALQPIPAPDTSRSNRAHAPEAAPQPLDVAYERPSLDFSSAESAMAVMAYAMQTKDGALLLDCFAKNAEWQSVNTVEKPWQRSKLSYASLVAGVNEGGDYRGFFFGDDGDDSFRDYFVGAHQGAWKNVGNQRFEPRESSPEQPTYVQWKKYGRRYVVSELAFPAD